MKRAAEHAVFVYIRAHLKIYENLADLKCSTKREHFAPHWSLCTQKWYLTNLETVPCLYHKQRETCTKSSSFHNAFLRVKVNHAKIKATSSYYSVPIFFSSLILLCQRSIILYRRRSLGIR